MKKKIKLRAINDVNTFVKQILDFPCDIDAIYGRYIIDAKSILGMIDISTHDIEVEIRSEDKGLIDKFATICKSYEV